MSPPPWQFFIDVGGTFTDVVSRRPDESIVTHKVLSSGVVRGTVGNGSSRTHVLDAHRIGEPAHLWKGYRIRFLGSPKDDADTRRISDFDPSRGSLSLDPPISRAPTPNSAYELFSDEDAPVVAIRMLLGIPLDEPIPAIQVHLGTTRATNALLERTGGPVVLVTTRGFGDVLRIGYQDRPKLFELNIRKREELFADVIEVDERVAADGTILRPPDPTAVRRQLEGARALGLQTAAICLLHAHVNPAHEELIALIADQAGFDHVSVSSRLARMERIVPRGDTTVVDAYLAPIVREYVARLRRSMPAARLRLMTSAGGLVDADRASAKDLLLSGPAGGVIGCALVARQAGIEKTIGFDMGGTSTDVCRIDPPPNEFEYMQETVKDGVRIMTPMLAIETVAAGGGSICAFDGIKLTVGPRSAGADPGPACYGRSGPLTITDVNLFLGRVLAEHFPFPLNREVVETKLAELAAEVLAASGSRLDETTLAEGFVRIANEKMAAAIKRISIAKGYDAREYTLTTFGGAAAQHACAIARLLGIKQILCSPFAGVLSAVGIGHARVKRIAQRSVRQDLNNAMYEYIEPVFDDLEADLRKELDRDGVEGAQLDEPVRSMDLCYAGQSSTITVPSEPVASARGRFEASHRQLYGYVHARRPIEVSAVRVELSAGSDLQGAFAPILPVGGPSAPGISPLVVNGKSIVAELFQRDQLAIGQRVVGPAIVVESTSTIVVDPGWTAEVLSTGDLLMNDSGERVSVERISEQADPVRLELFNNQFAAIAEQMGTTLRRTALSVNVKERLDFSCAIFTPSGDLVVNAPHIPVHLGGMSDCVKALMEDVRQFEPGDVYVTNDPFRGGSHLNDVTVITPVHDDTLSRILFFVASRAHHAEIGGTRPGSMPPDSTTLAEEGVLIRAFRWMRGGIAEHEALQALLSAPPHPTRSPNENLADIVAQTAANQTGVRELGRLMQRYGINVVHSYMRHIQTAAELKMRATLQKLPKGVHKFEDSLDDGSVIRLAVTIDDTAVQFDFTGTASVHSGNLNANPAIVTSAILYCLRCLIVDDIPLNAGVLAPVRIILPECLLNPPAHDDPARCPAIVGGNVETSQRIVDCVFGALGTVAAGQGTMNNLLMGNDRFGYYETICGGAGAGDGFHGADAVHTHMTNTRLTDPEVLESRVPVRLIRFQIRKRSGGQGMYRGGDGVEREMEFLEPLQVSILSQRRTTQPYGLHGGGAGAAGRNLLQRAGDLEAILLPSIISFEARPGDRLTIETPGGGGWGMA